MAVQISGNDITVPRDTTVTRNLTVGGVLTYEDVTNVDSVGLITARSGIKVTSGDIAMDTAGNITLGDSGGATDDRIAVGAGGDLHIYHDGTDSYVSNATGDLKLFSVGGSADDVIIRAQDDIELQPNNGEAGIKVIGDGAVELYHNNTKMFETTTLGVRSYGILSTDSYINIANSADLFLSDNGKATFGDGSDLQVYHDGSNNFIEARGVGDVTTFKTSNSSAADTGAFAVRANGDTSRNDAIKLLFGNSDDLQIYHDGSHSYIAETGQGNLRILTSSVFTVNNADNNKNMILATDGGSVDLFNDGNKKLETTSTGVTVTGEISDTIGLLRAFPVTAYASNVVVASHHAGKTLTNTSGGWTINASTDFATGEVMRVVNKSGSGQVVYQGGTATVYSSRDSGTSGDHTIKARGSAIIICTGTDEYYVSGDI